MRRLWPLWLILALSAGRADVPGLIFYTGFDSGFSGQIGRGWKLQLPDRPRVPGRFGQAYRFERGRANLLTANQAGVETGTDGFVAGPGVKLAKTAPPQPKLGMALQALPAAPGVLWTLTPRDLAAQNPNRTTITFVLSAYLYAGKPGARVRLSLRDELETGSWTADLTAANKATLDKDPNAKTTPPFVTVSQPGEAQLGGNWQRVMALLEIDGRRKAQQLVGQLELLDGSAAVLADCLQLEQAAHYPTVNTAPTSWLPGGESTGPGWLDFLASPSGFDGKAGTLACWARSLPDECGGTRPMGPSLAVGTGWFAPVWTVGGPSWYGGALSASGFKKCVMHLGDPEKRLQEAGAYDGWHHLALTWDEAEAVAYCDGQRLGRCDSQYARPAHGTTIRLGGSYLEHFPMTGDLDEVALLSRRFTDAEVLALAQRAQPLAADLPPAPLHLIAPPRLTFLRSEATAALALRPDSDTPVPVTAQLPAFRASVAGKASRAKPLVLPFKPWLMPPGKYPFSVQIGSGPTKAVVAGDVEIFEQPPGRFIIYGWGETDDLEKIGLNAAVCGGPGAQRDLLERGLWANSRIDIREAVPHPWSPWNRKRSEPIARATARAAMANPNVWSCLVNSEVGDAPFPKPEDEPWFTAWMKQETGLTGLPPEIVRDPVHAAPIKDKTPPAVLPPDYPAYKFLNWWGERGVGWWLLNNQLAQWMRAEGLNVVYYSDQPEAVTQFAAMDMVDYWGYPKVPEGLVARFNHAANMAKLLNKRFQAMPGTVYWDDGNGLWVTDTDGKRKVLCLSPDCLRENLWLSVACPSDSVGIYGLGERKTEIYDPACDQVMAETYGLIQPIGTLVGGMPPEQPPVAMLETEGLDFTQPGIYDNWIRHWVTRNTSRILARARLPFDWITDAHAEAGWLSRYKAVVLPGAYCLPQATHQALVAYARAGGKVIADGALRADIPGVQRVNLATQTDPQEAQEREWGGWARQFRETVSGFAQVEPRDKVFAYTRHSGPARVLFIINDHREPGPQQERFKITQMPADGGGPLRDRGLPQEVTVTVPAGLALYDVLAHKALVTTPAGSPSAQTGSASLNATPRPGDGGGRQQVTLTLAPGAAAVIACLPQAIAKVAVELPATLKPGTETMLKVRVLDKLGKPVAGRQLVEVKVTTPDGAWLGVQRYTRVDNGALDLPLRLPLTAKGEWRVEVREWLTGMVTEKAVRVQ